MTRTEDAKRAAGVWIRLVKCHGLMLREIRKQVAESETTLPQFDVLAQLLRHPDGVTSTELSRTLLVTAGNLTGIVDRLEARRLVTRTIDSEDKRVRVLRLTAKGKRLAKREVEQHEQWLDEILSDISDAERVRLNKVLDHLRTRLAQPQG